MAKYEVKLKDGDNEIYPQAVLNGVDTDNIIASGSVYEYTATEMCFVEIGVFKSHCDITIDGVRVASIEGQANAYSTIIVPLLKGQTIKMSNFTSEYGIPLMTVFGIKR